MDGNAKGRTTRNIFIYTHQAGQVLLWEQTTQDSQRLYTTKVDLLLTQSLLWVQGLSRTACGDLVIQASPILHHLAMARKETCRTYRLSGYHAEGEINPQTPMRSRTKMIKKGLLLELHNVLGTADRCKEM